MYAVRGSLNSASAVAYLMSRLGTSGMSRRAVITSAADIYIEDGAECTACPRVGPALCMHDVTTI